MVDQRANLDYGRDDDATDEVTEITGDDYLTSDRVAAIDRPSGVDAPLGEDSVGDRDENEEASTYGAP